MHPRHRITRLLALVASLSCTSIQPAPAQPSDLGFSNPTRLMPQSGEALYAAVCQGCHMPGSIGAIGAGAYPPLASNPRLAVVGYVVSIVIKGRKGMPPFGSLLTDAQVAAVANYVRTHFGNDFQDEVTAADASAVR